mgnify:FL=1
MSNIKKKFIIMTIIVVCLIIGITYWIYENSGSTLVYERKLDNNMSATKKAVIVKVLPNALWVMEPENYDDLIEVTYSEENNSKFKQGQEILIYYNKEWQLDKSLKILIMNVGKIESLKEKSEVEIPKNMIIACYNSKDNIEVYDMSITNKKLEYKIKDINDYKYEISESYEIYKIEQNENKDLISFNEKMQKEKETENITSYNYDLGMLEERKISIYNLR